LPNYSKLFELGFPFLKEVQETLEMAPGGYNVTIDRTKKQESGSTQQQKLFKRISTTKIGSVSAKMLAFYVVIQLMRFILVVVVPHHYTDKEAVLNTKPFRKRYNRVTSKK